MLLGVGLIGGQSFTVADHELQYAGAKRVVLISAKRRTDHGACQTDTESCDPTLHLTTAQSYPFKGNHTSVSAGQNRTQPFLCGCITNTLIDPFGLV